MTTEEQITFIENIIKKRFKKYKEKINIINTSTRHSVLFDTIEKQ